jgi:flagellar L-ring protein precursor FlgH
MKRFLFARTLLCLALAGDGSCALADSLYHESSFRPLTGDKKAHKVGDLLTIQVYESASASTSSDTGTRRNNGLRADLVNGGGRGGHFSLNTSGDFDGGGHTQRSNKFLTTLTVTVTEVLAGGDLLVGGEQVLTLNEEQQRVKMQGRVRPADISDSNVVVSTRLADAQITYLGHGVLSERQKRSWWRVFTDLLGL